MKKLISKVVEPFKKRFAAAPDVISSAPGRVNLIGEHTDYTGGFVLPVAIDKEIIFAAKITGGSVISGYSVDFDEEASCKVGEYDPGHSSGWFRYIMGVLSELERSDINIEGFTFTVGGDVNIGSGLSSSAALETAVLTAMEGLFKFKMDDKEAALLCQRAENDFVGMNCGIMDQSISRMGVKEHALFIDCSDLSMKPVKINLPEYSWVVIDSMKRRGLVDSEYNTRRRQCEDGLKSAQSAFSNRKINGLRDISISDLNILKNSCDETVFRRVKHIVTENERVLSTVQALESGNIDAVSRNLYASHDSMRDDFEISCEELDMLVEILSGIDGVFGARLTGAGFGGCVITLAQNSALNHVQKAITGHYHPASLPVDTKAEIWPIKISDGARIITDI
ncbi:MAG: galactokinase [Candidatus Latescibacteria bacterium]|jgi:galactokinase|nr:galactokinase [Candidatus Latescibacterota bacterium]